MTYKDIGNKLRGIRRKYKSLIEYHGHIYDDILREYHYISLYQAAKKAKDIKPNEIAEQQLVKQVEEFNREIEDIANHIKVYSSDEHRMLYHILSNDYEAAMTIAESSLGHIITRATHIIKEKKIPRRKIKDRARYIGLLCGDCKVELEQYVITKYNSRDCKRALELLPMILLAIFAAETSKETIRKYNETIKEEDNIDTLDDIIVRIKAYTLLRVLDYDIYDNEQWPFNGESASSLIYRKLNENSITSEQKLKMNLLGLSEYADIPLIEYKYLESLRSIAEINISKNK